MSFEDIEERIKVFFREVHQKQSESKKFAVMKSNILDVYVARGRHKKPMGFFIARFASALVSFVFIFAFTTFFLDSSKNVQAGTISSKYGPTEVIRNGEMVLIKGHMKLKIGDIVRVGNNAEAEIILPNQLITTAKNKTTFQVLGEGSLFLEEGVLENEALRQSEILVGRGIVESPSGSKFNVYVSESGEVRITSEYSGVDVMDFNERKVSLQEGDELLLRTDTVLSEYTELPADLQLSSRQLQAINARFIISRTKILTGMEHLLARENEEAEKDFISAEKSYKSIAQVLLSTRNLEILKRKNLESLEIEDIFPLLSMKVKNEHYLTEAKALEDLFAILEENQGNIAFSSANTGVDSFDRFVTLKRIYSLGNKNQRTFEDVLLQKYIVAFLRQIQNEELRIDQITILNEQIEKLPKNDLAYEFLDRTSKILAPGIAMILNEKLERVF